MADPFRPDTKSQLLREAQVGLSIVAILLVLLVYVAFYRITGRGRHIPDHVRNAPIAQLVWPGEKDQQVVVNEIEMTAQQFRETRLPKMTATVPESAATPFVAPASTSRTVDSTQPSPYRSAPSPAAMAETKTSRPSVPLGNPNFSPNKDRDSQPLHSKVAMKTEVKPDLQSLPVKLPKTAGDPSELAFPDPASEKLKPDTDDPFVASTLPLVKPFEKQVDSNVEPASLESDGNDFAITLPTEVKVAPIATENLEAVPTKANPANPIAISNVNPAPLDNNNEFNPGQFKANSNGLRPRKATSNSDSTKVESPVKKVESAVKSPLKSPVNSALNLADTSFKPISNASRISPQSDLSDPFLDPEPELDPSRPVVDQDSARIAKRLPRSVPDWNAPILPVPTEGNAAEEQLEYIAQPGDSFWSIAQSVYNDGRYFRALYKYNEPSVPEFDSLEPGTKIGTPSIEDLAKLWPDLCPASETTQPDQVQPKPESANARIYITRRGDTVFDIARQRLGQASRYSEILKLNQVWLGQEISHLTPLDEGVRLVMPQ